MRLIISGGGTGGHVFPAIAIADALKEVDQSIEILFVGALGKMEMERVPKAGYKIVGLPVAGFHRTKMWRNITFPFKLLRSMRQARKVVKQFQPDAAIGVGGYASGPILKAVNWVGKKTFLQEQNSFAGVTNKLLAKNADRIFVAYDKMEAFFPADRIVLTGNPVRSEIANVQLSKQEAKQKMQLEQADKVVLISGGSLGARAINEAVLNMQSWIKSNPTIHFYWQVGKLYLKEFKAKPIAALDNVTVTAFIEDMAAAYTAADLIICRAGALTISEITLLGKAAILMPSPNVAEDHQKHNALALVEVGAASMIEDKNSEALEEEVKRLIHDPSALMEIETQSKSLGKQQAAQVIAKEIWNRLKDNK